MKIPFFSTLKTANKLLAPKAMLFYWYKHHKIVFFMVFLVVLCIGGWKWYYSLYRYQLSDEEKKQYIETNFKETLFKEAKFLDVVGRLTARERMHEETIQLKRDIFGGQ